MKIKGLQLLLLALSCSALIAAPARAIEGKGLHIPAGDLPSALEALAKQSGAELVYQMDQVKGLRTRGVDGDIPPEQALKKLLRGTALVVHTDKSGAMLITTAATGAKPGAEPAALSTAGVAAGSSETSTEAPSQNPTPAAGATPTEPQASQNTEAPSEEKGMQEIIVTGTLIRGIAPPGASEVTLDAQAIAATGAVSTNEVLKNIPQLAEFGNTNQQITTVNFQVTVDRPNIRNLPGVGTNGGSTTLVLVDGHRLVGEGIKETAPDPNTVPVALLERVEVLPDGGSSIYGSDAIGGVINFITKRHFEGVQVDGRFGFAPNYQSYEANGTFGHDWGSGSAYLGYSYTDNTPLYSYERPYVRQYTTSGGPNPALTCVPGNVTVNRGGAQTVYAVPALLPNTANNCDNSLYSTFFAGQVRNSVFAGVDQDITSGIKFDLRAYYSNQSQRNIGNLTSTGNIGATNPYYTRTADNPAPQPPNIEVASISWGPALGYRYGRLQTSLESWGATPIFTFDVGKTGWQIREMINYGGSRTVVNNPEINPTALTQALAGTTTQTALNPYNPAATNPAVLAKIANYQLYGLSRQHLINDRLVADGGLFPLPGGEVHSAVGGEYIYEYYNATLANQVPGSSPPFSTASRTSFAGFAEVNIPIFGEPNAVLGIHSLSLNGSVRYDHYSDFGGTTNGKVALTYQPVDWVAIRGNWGSSFQAPSLADTAAVDNSIFVAPAIIYPSVIPGQFSPSQALDPLIFAQGGLPGLKPQTAHTAEIGTDISPPIVPGLKLGLTYYYILFHDIISTPAVGSPITFWTYYKNSYVLSPTNAQVLAFASQIPGGVAIVAPYLLPGSLPVYAIVDARRRNLGNAKIGGLDFTLNYAHKTSFGSVDFSFNGNYSLQYETQPLPGLPYIDNNKSDQSRAFFAATAGANIHDLRAQATVNYVGGFNVTPTIANNNQDWLRAFTVVNLFFNYDFSHMDIKGTGLTHNLSFSLSINNVFNQDAPHYSGTYNTLYNGYANGATVGRLVQIGVVKKF
jgi:iron complex outermembrane receptor protein